MPDYSGFLSYVHSDNDANDGRILKLAAKVSMEYQVLTGDDPLTIFSDRDDILWGEEWETRITQAIELTSFFIPIVTPSFFKSDACRSELISFRGKARSLGFDSLLLPIYYVDVPQLNAESPGDELMAVIGRTQYFDWRSLRLEDETSSDYRKSVSGMASRILEAVRDAEARTTSLAFDETTPSSEASSLDDQPVDHDRPGYLDTLAEREPEAAFDDVTKVVGELAKEIELLGSTVRDSPEKEAIGNADRMATKLFAMRSLARKLQPHATATHDLGQEYGRELVELDPWVLAMLTMVKIGVIPEQTPTERPSRETFVRSVLELRDTARDSVSQLTSMVETMQPMMDSSKDMRRELTKVQTGVRSIQDGQRILEKWANEASRLSDLMEETWGPPNTDFDAGSAAADDPTESRG